ncbi:hypothetical protein RB195_018328 [Necator americanus]
MIDFFEQQQQPNRTMRRCGPTPALTIIQRFTIKLRRRRSPWLLYGRREVLQRRVYLLLLVISMPKLVREERMRNFTSGPTTAKKRTGGEAFRVYAGRGFHPVERTILKRFCLTDVAVVPKFYTGSDHRLFRKYRYASKLLRRFRNGQHEKYDRLVEHLHDSEI